MNIVDPRIDPSLVSEGSKPIIIARHDPRYRPLPSVRTPRGQVITRWAFEAHERTDVAAGADLFVTILSHGAVNPIALTVGPTNWIDQPIDGDPPQPEVETGHTRLVRELHGVLIDTLRFKFHDFQTRDAFPKVNLVVMLNHIIENVKSGMYNNGPKEDR